MNAGQGRVGGQFGGGHEGIKLIMAKLTDAAEEAPSFCEQK
jgi:hypothetical protein